MSSSKTNVILYIDQKETSIVADTLVLSPAWLIPEKWNLIHHANDEYFLISSTSKQYLHIQKTLDFYNLQISTLSTLWTWEDNHYLSQTMGTQKMYIYIDTTTNTIQASPSVKSMIEFRSI
jgi:hypothetical protein